MKVHELNESLTFVCRMCDGSQSCEEMGIALMKRYGLNVETASKETYCALKLPGHRWFDRFAMRHPYRLHLGWRELGNEIADRASNRHGGRLQKPLNLRNRLCLKESSGLNWKVRF